MNISLPSSRKKGGFTHGINLRIINKLDIQPEDLINEEVVISKDYITNETLIGRPLGLKVRYEGYLYEKFLNLNLDRNVRKDISTEEKQKIMDFISKYAIPYYSPMELISIFRENINNSDYESRDEISWLFIPYVSKPQDRNSVSFFYIFRNAYINFQDAVKIATNKNYKNLEYLEGVFNNMLKGNYPQIDIQQLKKGEYGLKWISQTSLQQCYFELFNFILSRQTLKECKYCGNKFEGSKSNVVRCADCRKPSIYRKQYYEKHKVEERRKARVRMKNLRSKIKLNRVKKLG